MRSSALALAVLAVGVGIAAAIDLKTRRVPNALTSTLAVAGVVLAATGASGLGLKAALVGGVLGLLLMLPGYCLGGTGAGDVKLLGAVGTLVGPAVIPMAFLYTALAGGAMALLVAAQRRQLAATLGRTGRLAAGAGNTAEIEHPRRNNRFAYAPAIAIGSVLAAWGGWGASLGG